ncbi:DUF5691 domain-containing protein [Ktedonobacter robiniae]|uniref:HEAT repeat domain-containing protein n=1 Tax=Ktedonobacter robiniae TaxID=2778365 RepID=A0ABQ3UQM6_9CHLR|nr:DUF5691 domain-containing protein [Ktedonobacter robiniae]GHO54991.1 hypothetical protein KSB_34660 [Ktedonobacter robiniae]
MERFITAAIVGTEQSGDTALTTGTRIDELSSQLSEGGKEHQLLLTAAAWGAYQNAGHLAESAPELPAPAQPESQDWYPLQRPQILEMLLPHKETALLQEALGYMQERRCRVPYDLLPAFLETVTRGKELREQALPLLGERGRWLSQHNPKWNWVNELSTEAGAIPAEQIEATWQEGTLKQRVEALRQQRLLAPDTARQWLQQSWKKERADTRAPLLEILALKLSPEDEDFLEKALDDRSEQVRLVAIRLLAMLPGSAFMQRMRAQAGTLFQYQKGKIAVHKPATLDKSWVRDGLINRVENTSGINDACQRLLEHLPLAYWEERFSLAPYQLLEAIENKTWQHMLFTVLCRRAAREYHLPSIDSLLAFWQEAQPDALRDARREERNLEIAGLISRLSQQQAEGIFKGMLGSHFASHILNVSVLPRPWSHNFGTFYLDWAREVVHNFPIETETGKATLEYLRLTLPPAALAFPPTCFPLALQEWNLPDLPEKYEYSIYYEHQQTKNSVNHFLETIHLRKMIVEEIG